MSRQYNMFEGTFNPVDKVQALLGSNFHWTNSPYDSVIEGKRQWLENGPCSAWSVWSDSLWRYSPTWQNMKKHTEASFKYNLFSTNPSDISSSCSSSDSKWTHMGEAGLKGFLSGSLGAAFWQKVYWPFWKTPTALSSRLTVLTESLISQEAQYKNVLSLMM